MERISVGWQSGEKLTGQVKIKSADKLVECYVIVVCRAPPQTKSHFYKTMLTYSLNGVECRATKKGGTSSSECNECEDGCASYREK